MRAPHDGWKCIRSALRTRSTAKTDGSVSVQRVQAPQTPATCLTEGGGDGNVLGFHHRETAWQIHVAFVAGPRPQHLQCQQLSLDLLVCEAAMSLRKSNAFSICRYLGEMSSMTRRRKNAYASAPVSQVLRWYHRGRPQGYLRGLHPFSLSLLGAPGTGWIRRGFRRSPELPPSRSA